MQIITMRTRKEFAAPFKCGERFSVKDGDGRVVETRERTWDVVEHRGPFDHHTFLVGGYLDMRTN